MKNKAVVGVKPKNKSFLLKRIISLMINKASLKQYYLEIGVYFLKKGVGYDVDQILEHKNVYDKTYKVKVVTDIFYSFRTNKISHAAKTKLIQIK